MKHNTTSLLIGLLALLLGTGAHADEQDKLSAILIPGEDWQVAAEGHTFVDGPTFDKDGNVYFSDLKKPVGIYKLTPDGKKTLVTEKARSGNKISADGKLYSVGETKLSVFTLPEGTETVLATDIKTNDLVVSYTGLIYLTETGRKQVTFVDIKTGEKKPADVGINKPNGIAFSPDQQTLYVSDYGGINVWSFKVNSDGALTDKKPVMTMKAPDTKPGIAGGDGMICDTDGRAYVSTSLGIQIFAPTGELLGILPKPSGNTLTSVGFGGTNRDYLIATCGDKLMKRHVKTHGVATFENPAK